MRPPLIVHHAHCPDGFGAAWWLGRHLGEHEKYAESYDRLAPVEECEDRDVWIVDFCYPAMDLKSIADVARSLTVLDHHQTARRSMEQFAEWEDIEVVNLRTFCSMNADGFLQRVQLVHEEDMSGAGMVARFVQEEWGTPMPGFLLNVEDRDLWKFARSTTRPVMAAVMSRQYTVDEWDAMWVTPLADLVLEGEGINRFRDKLIADTVDTAFEMNVCGHMVWVAACPYTIGSDVAGILAQRNPELFGAYFIPKGDRVQWGLRSGPDGMDVAKLAEQHGGGGHRHASGFTATAGLT